MIEKIFGAIMCLLAFLPAILDHGKRRNDWQTAKGRTQKWNTGLQYFLINWGLPLGGAVGLVLNFLESVESKHEIQGLTKNVEVLSNELVGARSQLRETESKTVGDIVVLSNDLVDARAKLASVDPMKQPIVTVNARVTMYAKGLNRESDLFSKIQFGSSAHLKTNKNNWKLILHATDFQQRDGGELYRIEFGANPYWGLSVDKDRLVESIDAWDTVHFEAPFLHRHSEILKGELTVTLNSTVQRKYPIPPHNFRNGIWWPTNRVNVRVSPSRW